VPNHADAGFRAILAIFADLLALMARGEGDRTGYRPVELDTSGARRGMWVPPLPQKKNPSWGWRKRFDVMYNDFVLIGPMDDPAGLGWTSRLL
jgi:hypothetical protein